MTIARTAADVLNEHVTLEIEGIDRMYLNLYVPILQCPRGVGHFWINHRGHQFASSALMAPMTDAFVSPIKNFAKTEGIDVVRSRRGSARTRWLRGTWPRSTRWCASGYAPAWQAWRLTKSRPRRCHSGGLSSESIRSFNRHGRPNYVAAHLECLQLLGSGHRNL